MPILIIAFLSFILLIQLLRGRISPKLAFPLLIIGILAAFYLKEEKSVEKKATTVPLIKSKDTLKIPPNKETPPPAKIADREIDAKEKIAKSPVKKQYPKYKITVQIKGISDADFLKNFEKKSGYTIAKKADYLIEFSHSGSIKPDKTIANNRFIFSGGHLIATINKEACCCQGLITIPNDIPLGKTINEANKILAQKITELSLENSDKIISMISECLPKH